MGQLVGVVEKPSTTPGVVRFEINRSLSGQGHERFNSVLDAFGPNPSASLARQLFATGRVAAVHIYGNIVTVDIEKGFDSTGLSEIIRDMYMYWKAGVEPPSFEDLQPPEEVTSGGDASAGGDGELSEAAKLVPANLLERSRLGRERLAARGG